ncbi:MAG: transcriptional regulator, LuxR family [Conexibacter sp.]|nr:transcriptional regulator, LuxR family [Conexibacter sp.]
MEQVAARAGERPGTWIALTLRHARALLADPEEAGERFEEALACELSRWPRGCPTTVDEWRGLGDVLVHGGFVDGSGWRPVYDLRPRRGLAERRAAPLAQVVLELAGLDHLAP